MRTSTLPHHLSPQPEDHPGNTPGTRNPHHLSPQPQDHPGNTPGTPGGRHGRGGPSTQPPDLASSGRRRARAFAFLLLALTACSSPENGATDTSDGLTLRGEVLVSAAASLTDAFGEIEAAFESTYPGTDVVLNFGGSSALREQILGGAPADVFASANLSNMDRIETAGHVAGEPQIFARNLLQIAVPGGNPAGITGVEDFGRDDLLIGLCAEGVPCGDFAREALSRAGVEPAPDTNEPDVRALLTKIEVGELDAGITYVTDVTSAEGRVEGVDIPEAFNVVAEYPIAVLTDAPNPRVAAAFVDFVVTGPGRELLLAHGFATP